MSKEKILVVEDAPDISGLLKIYFTSQGYEVLTAMRGQVALEICRKTPPNLALLDVNLPDMEGYDIGKALRSSPRTRHIPIIFLTARGEKQDRLKGLGEVQAENYILKPFDIEEVHTIVRGALERANQRNLSHPVTNLPTAELINEQYRTLLNSQGWALAQISINAFEAFTLVYGSIAGEEVLKFMSLLLNDTMNELGRPEDFIGQMIVGPVFLVTTSPANIEQICNRLCERFDAEIGPHYNYQDRRNGYVTTADDLGNPRQVPLMSLSIGVLTSEDGPFYDIRELSESAEEARQRALAESREQKYKSRYSRGRA